MNPPENRRPRIAVLATGGTIAGAGEGPTGSAYRSGELGIEELLASVPGAEDIAELMGEELARIGSQDMSEEIWLTLARRIRSLLAEERVDGIVVTHGTDTLEETAFFLECVLGSFAPVVLTGAMRPATGLSADGPRNLLDALRVAASPAARGRGVLIVMDESIHTARGVTKMDTTYVSAFRSPTLGPAGSIVSGVPHFFRADPESRLPGRALSLSEVKKLPQVEILFAHVGMDPVAVDDALARGCRGLVLAGLGRGNAPHGVLERLRAAAAAGTIVLRSSRAPSGFVTRNVEIDDDECGFIVSADLNPQKARILLQLALLESTEAGHIQTLFEGI